MKEIQGKPSMVQVSARFELSGVSCIQLFRERLSEKVHVTIPKGIVGGFEFTVVQRNLKEGQERLWTCLRVLKENNNSRFDSYYVRNSVLIISIVASHFFPTFLEIAVYNTLHAHLWRREMILF